MEEEASEGLGGKLDFLAHFSALSDPRQLYKFLLNLTDGVFLHACEPWRGRSWSG